MITRRDTPQVVGDESTVEEAKYGRSLWLILRLIALIVALWAFIASLSAFLQGAELRLVLAVVFLLGSYTLLTKTPPKSLWDWILWLFVFPGFASARKHAIEGDGTEKARQHRLPDWPIVVYCLIIGLGCNWACAFLWFSRRYALFSGPVAGATGLIVALYGVIALLSSILIGGNWRRALVFFLFAPGVLGAIILRLHFLR